MLKIAALSAFAVCFIAVKAYEGSLDDIDDDELIENVRLQLIEEKVLSKLVYPNDTFLQKQVKRELAKFIVATVMSEYRPGPGKPGKRAPADDASATCFCREVSTTAATTAEVQQVATSTAKAEEPPTTTKQPDYLRQETEATTKAAASASGSTSRRPSVAPQHVFNQVSNILDSVRAANVSGIVDQSLGIRTSTPVRNFVNGLLKVILGPVGQGLG